MNEVYYRLFSEKNLLLNFIRFYLVGFILFAIPFSRQFFISITPLSLLMMFGLVFFYHHPWDKKNILLFGIILVSGFFLEMAGTVSGKIFGEYSYGRGLGYKINGTPVIIGLNWLFLTYASHNIANHLVRKNTYRILIGASLMVAYDILLEWVAPFMKMWQFTTKYPPLQNYVAWFFIGVIYNLAFRIFYIRTNNPPAVWLFVVQLCFFVLVGVYCEIFLR